LAPDDIDEVIGTLVLDYEATWVFEGTLIALPPDPPDFSSDIRARYTVDDGTGIFDGARGHGWMFVTGGVFLAGVINGSFNVK
jgi:hypothetical protein